MNICKDCGHLEGDHKKLRVGGDGRVIAVRCYAELNTVWAGPERICGCREFKGGKVKIDETKMYVVEGVLLGYVQRVMERLFKNDFQRLTADESRDLANGLFAHLDAHVVEYPEEGKC